MQNDPLYIRLDESFKVGKTHDEIAQYARNFRDRLEEIDDDAFIKLFTLSMGISLATNTDDRLRYIVLEAVNRISN